VAGILGIDAAWTEKEPSRVALIEGSREGWRCVAVTPSYGSSLSQVRSRVVEAYGERSTIVRASRRILSSFSDWKVLEEASERGVYQAGPIHRLEDPELIAWLIEASLLAGGQQTKALPTLLASPSLFPFDINLSGRDFAESSPRIALYRQGRNEELVSLQPSR
jgi:hypothetical protein